jgi:dipeptidyl aminopeptidase/acylaminoacyl peptidase
MKPVQIEDLLSYRFLSAVEISPDGRRAAFVVKQADAEKNEYSSDIHLVDLDSRDVRRLTSGGKDGPFAWGKDGSELLFLSRREEKEGSSFVFRIRVGGGEAERVAVLPHKADGLRWLDDGRFLYTARVPLGDDIDREDAADYEVIDEIPFWMNGEGFTNQRRKHLLLFDPVAKEVKDFLDPRLEVTAFDVRANRCAVVGRRFEGKAPVVRELWIVDLLSGGTEQLAVGELLLDEVRFLDEGSLVVLGTDMEPYGLGQNREILSIDIASGSVASWTPGWDRSVGNSVAADCRHGGGPTLRVDGEDVFVSVTERTIGRLVQISRDGAVRAIVESAGSIDAYDVRNGLALTVGLRPTALQELYLHDAGGETRLTSLNEASMTDRAISSPERFSVSSSRGDEIDAWLIRPIDFDPNAEIPTILTIHGGPRGAYGEVFFHQMQMLAGKGYAILISNPHGSSGRGDEFADIRGEYGKVDHDDLMAVVDAALVRFPFLDKDRLGVMGGSYGGFMTNWMIGHTDRFRAAVSQRSIANWIHKFCTTDIGYYFNADQLRSDPWADGGSDKLWWHSPLRYADRAKTPTLFIHSEQDYRCWLPEGIQMFTALRYHGIETRLVMFREENHELSRSGKPKHRIRRLEEILAWFDRHLKGASAESPPAGS